MAKRLVHGTPITPRRLLPQLRGGSFCVSYMHPEQLDDCIELVGQDEILILDNGAFTAWRQGIELDEAWWDGFYTWANAAMDRCPQAVAVIPDVIGGDEDDNLMLMAQAIKGGKLKYPERAMAIWHMDESLEQLDKICAIFNFVGWGSCNEFDISRAKFGGAWHLRARTALARIDWLEMTTGRERPWIHMMRGLGQLHAWPFDSADSCNLAINQCRTKTKYVNHVQEFSDRLAAKVKGQELAPLPLFEVA